MYADTYMQKLNDILHRAWETQKDTVHAVAGKLADTVRAGHNAFVFGCSHAGILAEEVFYRTGGLAVLNPIFFPGFMLNTRPVTLTSRLERLAGLGCALLDENHVSAGDFLLIHSVSGRNTVPVEMAIHARERGVYVACLTSLAYSRSVSSRHSSGKRLFEVCDAVIDNAGVPGDAVLTLPGLPEPIAPTSTAAGAALLNALVVDAVENLIASGVVPPVLMSANIDGGDAHNKEMFTKYKDHIFYQ